MHGYARYATEKAFLCYVMRSVSELKVTSRTSRVTARVSVHSKIVPHWLLYVLYRLSKLFLPFIFSTSKRDDRNAWPSMYFVKSVQLGVYFPKPTRLCNKETFLFDCVRIYGPKYGPHAERWGWKETIVARLLSHMVAVILLICISFLFLVQTFGFIILGLWFTQFDTCYTKADLKSKRQ